MENIKPSKDSLGAVQERLLSKPPEPTWDDLEWIDQTGEPPIPQGQAVAASEPTRPLTVPTAGADCEETPHSHSTTTSAHDSASAMPSTSPLRAVDTFDVGEGGADVYTAAAGLKKAPVIDEQPVVMLQPNMPQEQLDKIYENVEARMTAYTTRPYRLKPNEYKTLNSLLVSGVPVDFIFANIDYSFVIKPEANSFQYCSYVIKSQWDVELAKKAPAEKIKWGEGQARKKNIGSGSLSQTKVDRVVPAAQPGKYERFYQVYQGKNIEEKPLQSEKSEQPAEKLLKVQSDRNGYGFDHAIGKMNHDGNDIIL
jgi:hypothetical protein